MFLQPDVSFYRCKDKGNSFMSMSVKVSYALSCFDQRFEMNRMLCRKACHEKELSRLQWFIVGIFYFLRTMGISYFESLNHCWPCVLEAVVDEGSKQALRRVHTFAEQSKMEALKESIYLMNWFPIGMVVTLWFAYTHFVKPPDQYAPNLDIHVDINSFWFDRETIKHTDTIHTQVQGRRKATKGCGTHD